MPKPLLPVAGKPIIEHVLKKIEELDEIDKVFIVTNNKFFDNFRNWKRIYSGTKPIEIINDGTLSDEDKLGATGDIDFVVSQEGINDDVLIIAGDNLFDFSLKHLHDTFKGKGASVIALYNIKDKNMASGKYGVVEIGNNGKIIDLEEKPKEPKTALISTASYLLLKEDIQQLKKYVKESKKPDNLGDFMQWLVKRKLVYGYVFEGAWFDIGSKEQLKEADVVWSNKR